MPGRPMTRQRCLVVAFSCVLTGCVVAHPGADHPRASSPDPVPGIFAAWDSLHTPGCTAAADAPGVRRRIAVGRASLEFATPNTDTTRFEAASVSKQVTAAALLLLVVERRLALDADVRPLLPELRAGSPITVRHLLGHTSGFRDGQSLLLLRDGYGFTTEISPPELWYLLGRQRRLSFAPGTQQVYSNTGYLAAARIVERITGQSFPEFTRKRFFEPLGMTRTTWRGGISEVIVGRALGYRAGTAGYERINPRVMEIGPGGLVTTVDDLQRWNAALASRSVAGGRELVTLMETPTRLADGSAGIFGMGLMIPSAGSRREFGHDGGSDGYSAFAARYPDDSINVAVLCNDEGANAAVLGRALAALYFRSDKPVAEPEAALTRTGAFPAQYAAGAYVDTILGRVLRLEARGDSVAAGGLVFAPVDSRTFMRPGTGRIEVQGAPGSPATAVVTTNRRGQRVEFLRTRISSLGDSFAAYAGRYTSEELGVTYEIRAIRTGVAIGIAAPYGRLPFAFIGDEPLELPAVLPNWFVGRVFALRFVPNAQNQMTRLIVSHERARNIEFRREGDAR